MRASGEGVGRRRLLAPPLEGILTLESEQLRTMGQNPEERWASEKWIIIIILHKRKLRLQEESEPEAKAVEFENKSLSSAPQASLNLLLQAQTLCLGDAISLAIRLQRRARAGGGPWALHPPVSWRLRQSLGSSSWYQRIFFSWPK